MQGTHQVYELFIRATPERVWRAITDGSETTKYFFGTALSSSFETGAAFRYSFPDEVDAVSGQILEIEPGKRLVTSWAIHYDPSCKGENSRVTWALEAKRGNTRLTLTHECEGAPNTARGVGNDGWSFVLSGLKTLIETGEGLADG